MVERGPGESEEAEAMGSADFENDGKPEVSSFWVGTDSDPGVTVVYCVTITTAGGCGGDVESITLGEIDGEIDCSTDKVLCASLGITVCTEKPFDRGASPIDEGEG